MEVAWSKVGAIRRMLEDFPLEILQRLIRLVGSMVTHVVMQEQQWEDIEKIQTDHFNLLDHVHSVLGQKKCSACGILV
jgi:hypothetical protein